MIEYHSGDHAILTWTETQSAQTTPTSPMNFRGTRLEKLSTQLCSSTWRQSREKSGSVPSVVCVVVGMVGRVIVFPGGATTADAEVSRLSREYVLRYKAVQVIQSLQALERVQSHLYQGHLGSATMAPLQTALER